MSKNKSPVWKYFTVDDDDSSKAVCSVCQAKISRGGCDAKSYSTSALINHLERKHLDEYKTYCSSKAISETESFQSDRNGSGKLKRSAAQAQLGVMECFETAKLWDINHPKAQANTYRLGEMIILDDQPYSIIDDPGFLRYSHGLEPRYRVPSRKYFSETIVPDIYNRVHEKVRGLLAVAPGMKYTFTSDGWTSGVNNQSYYSLTAHWLTSDFERKAVVLDVKPFSGHHISDNIGSCMLTMLDSWGLKKDNVFLFVRDGAPNMVKAMRDASLPSISCFSHSLQLVVKDSIFEQRSISDIIAIGRKMVGHFAHSSSACGRLAEIQREEKIPEKKLVQDVQTRWNSTFYMLESLLEQRRALRLYAAETDKFTVFSTSQWDLVDKIVKLLRPVEEITRDVCRDESCVSMCLPGIKALSNFVSTAPSNDDVGVRGMKSAMRESLNERFGHYYQSMPHVVATILDPRYKMKIFSADQKVAVEKIVLEQLKNKILVGISSAGPAPAGQSQAEVERTAQEPQVHDNEPEHTFMAVTPNEIEKKIVTPSCSVWEFLDLDADTAGLPANDAAQLIENETEARIIAEMELNLKKYLALPELDKKANPLAWWREHKVTFPVLASLAQIFLGAPATSVASERLFSLTGNIATDKRNRLDPENLRRLAFVHYNLNKLNFQY